MRLIVTVILLILSAIGVLRAEPGDSLEAVRPVAASYMLSVGSSHLTDTYLTPLKYDGMHFGFEYERLQAMKFRPERWTQLLDLSLSLDQTENPARNATMWALMARVEWGMMHRWAQPIASVPGLKLALGGSASIEGGCLYNARNGNNPASAKGAFTLNLTGLATYGLTLGRLPVTLSWRPTLPLAGAFFSPDYGELYYEIWLGDHAGLCHFAWPGSYFCLDNLVTADLHFGATTLRVGYKGRVYSTEASHIVTNMATHSLVVGVSLDWISIDPRRGLPHRNKVKLYNAR